MTRFRLHISYELHCLRTSFWLVAVVVSSIATAVALTFIVGLFNSNYLELGIKQHWALISTQGGTFGWLPFFAFPLALLGVLMWAQDCGGDSGFVAYSSFPDRWLTAGVRTAILTILSTAISVGAQAVSLLVAVLFLDAPTLEGHWALVAVKTAWMAVCGTTFANLGAALCVLCRSPLAAISLLVLFPWILEPVVIELTALAQPLHWLEPALQFLPFRVAGDSLGSPYWESITDERLVQLTPSSAAIASFLWASLAALVVQWRYCTADGNGGR